MQRTSVATTVSIVAFVTGRRSAEAAITACCGGFGVRCAQSSTHCGVGLGQHELLKIVGVVIEVQSGPGSDFQAPSARAAEQVLAVAAHAGALSAARNGS